jgi:hypothetical protein
MVELCSTIRLTRTAWCFFKFLIFFWLTNLREKIAEGSRTRPTRTTWRRPTRAWWTRPSSTTWRAWGRFNESASAVIFRQSLSNIIGIQTLHSLTSPMIGYRQWVKMARAWWMNSVSLSSFLWFTPNSFTKLWIFCILCYYANPINVSIVYCQFTDEVLP